ncbi:uncharacterized protein CLUP02_03344 [Colletotrichum lupini]|uniref:Uncharacterized protein n=1 Tax=Colletotrichum lupini TaxID=145971 RepID=A0A9Q8WCM8_9PEZI|nr:uncharacterized protein CLUP02_03344 [Colletotrichum lupini]UQC77872.1 hypothetical protein CLUP02_03344 [Colletotrichum lupini]
MNDSGSCLGNVSPVSCTRSTSAAHHACNHTNPRIICRERTWAIWSTAYPFAVEIESWTQGRDMSIAVLAVQTAHASAPSKLLELLCSKHGAITTGQDVVVATTRIHDKITVPSLIPILSYPGTPDTGSFLQRARLSGLCSETLFHHRRVGGNNHNGIMLATNWIVPSPTLAHWSHSEPRGCRLRTGLLVSCALVEVEGQINAKISVMSESTSPFFCSPAGSTAPQPLPDQRVFCIGSSTFQLLKGRNVLAHGPPLFGLSFSNSHAPSVGFAGDLAFLTLHWVFPTPSSTQPLPPSPASRFLRHTRISQGGGALAAPFLLRPAVPVLFFGYTHFRNLEIWGNPMEDDRQFSGLPNFHLTPRDSYTIELISLHQLLVATIGTIPVGFKTRHALRRKPVQNEPSRSPVVLSSRLKLAMLFSIQPESLDRSMDVCKIFTQANVQTKYAFLQEVDTVSLNIQLIFPCSAKAIGSPPAQPCGKARFAGRRPSHWGRDLPLSVATPETTQPVKLGLVLPWMKIPGQVTIVAVTSSQRVLAGVKPATRGAANNGGAACIDDRRRPRGPKIGSQQTYPYLQLAATAQKPTSADFAARETPLRPLVRLHDGPFYSQASIHIRLGCHCKSTLSLPAMPTPGRSTASFRLYENVEFGREPRIRICLQTNPFCHNTNMSWFNIPFTTTWYPGFFACFPDMSLGDCPLISIRFWRGSRTVVPATGHSRTGQAISQSGNLVVAPLTRPLLLSKLPLRPSGVKGKFLGAFGLQPSLLMMDLLDISLMIGPHSPNLAVSSIANEAPEASFFPTTPQLTSAASKDYNLAKSHLQAVIARRLHPRVLDHPFYISTTMLDPVPLGRTNPHRLGGDAKFRREEGNPTLPETLYTPVLRRNSNAAIAVRRAIWFDIAVQGGARPGL